MLNNEFRHLDSGALKKLIHELDPQKNSEKFLLTRHEFQLIEESFKKIQANMNQLLGDQFTQEKIQFSDNKSLEDINQNLVSLSKGLYKFAVISADGKKN